VEVREIHIARDGIHNNRLSFSIRRLRAVAGEWRSAIRRHSPLWACAGVVANDCGICNLGV